MLRPQPHRGDVIAAGVVALTTLVALVNVRLDDDWGDGAHALYSAAAAAFVLALAVLAPTEGPAPRPYQSALYIAAMLLSTVALARVAQVLGSDGLDSPGTLAWVGGAVAALGWWLAVTRNSAICTLLAATASGVTLLALVQSAFAPEGVATARWVLLALIAVWALAAVAQRDRRPDHAVALVDAAGVATLGLALSFSFAAGDAESAGWGWELALFAVGFGLAAYSAVDRKPGPGWLGAAVLLVTVVVAGEGGSLVGWPLVLAAGAASLLAVGLRPSRPLPPEPVIEGRIVDLPEDRS